MALGISRLIVWMMALTLGTSLRAHDIPDLPSNKYPPEEKLEGLDSPYSNLIAEHMHSLGIKADDLTKASTLPLWMHWVKTASNPKYVGIEQSMIINAPLNQVIEVMEDFAHYSKLLSGFADVHVVSRDDNKLRIFWEQISGFFLVSNTKFELNYLINQTSPSRRLYRYKLASSNHLKASDGAVILETDGANRTRFAEFDFWDADWSGSLWALIGGRVRSESFDATYDADIALKLKSENPTWTYEKVHEETAKIKKQFALEKVIGEDVTSSEIFGAPAPAQKSLR